MKGDFTRFRFDPTQHRRRVYEQQGRVAVDADANESVDIAEYLREAGIRDVVGQSGGPLGGAGFAITAAGGDLKIGAGHYWVDGLLVENESAATSLAAQPYLPAGTSPVAAADGTPGAAPNDGVYAVFLETWERLVTAVEDDSLREPALGGPDTTTRTQQVWQVRLLRAGNVGTPFSCSSDLPAWNALIADPTVTLAARSAVSAAPPNDCTVPASAGFRGTENQHYRVEIHDPGALNTATFVWSRENGSVVLLWTGSNGNDLTVATAGHDGSLGFAPGDWVELIDETRELTGRPGTLVRLADASGDRLVIDPATATGSVAIAQFPRNPRVRRWDSDGPQTVRVPSANGGWLALELGAEVHWPASGTFRTGQWWAVPARTALGDVIWPQAGGAPAKLPPFGERHHFTRLAVAQLEAGAWKVLGDCRKLFPPLTGLTSLFALGGDGQEAPPNVANPAALVALPAPLRAGVANGTTPVANARVRFSVTTGSGTVNGQPNVVVPTNPNGVSSVAWSIDSTNALQTVTAQLVDDLGTPLHLPVQFDATLSTATEVSYDPKDCAKLAGKTTVQDAIDTLCATGGDGCATVVVTPGDNWEAPLLALEAGAHAHICFRPGTFTVKETVVLAKLGSLIVSGAGLGSHVVAPELEIALRFQDCDEVVVRDLGIEAAVVGVVPERPGMNGALTLEGCRRVVVESVGLTCAAGAARAGACLTVRASGATSPEVVRVRDCDLVVGHMQVGALVLDAQTTSITGTTIRVAPQPPKFQVLLADPDRRGALMRQLVGRAKATDGQQAPGRGFSTQLNVGVMTVAFESPVPQTEWRRLAAANPPTDAQLQSRAALQQWAAGLASSAVTNPRLLPTFERHVTTLQRQLGDAFHQVIGTEAGRTLLNSTLIVGPVAVLDPASTAAGGRRVLDAATGNVRFDSVLAEDDWRQLLSAGGAERPATGAALKLQMTALARRALDDTRLRARVPALSRWFDTLADRNLAVASTGVVVGGRTADSVVVADNDLRGVAEAVHVGVSSGSTLSSAGRVEIRGNRALMRVPVELERGPRGYFVGNAQHAVVSGNEMRVDPDAAEKLPADAVLEGVRAWGHFGSLVLVADNLLAGCETGVRVQPLSGPQRFRWDVSGNVAPDARTGVVAPTSVTRSGNVP